MPADDRSRVAATPDARGARGPARDPLRVLVPIGSDGLGGSELALLRLMDGCPRSEIEFTCWVFREDEPGGLCPELDARGIAWRPFPRVWLRSMWGLSRLERQLRRESPDVIYLHASRAIAWLARKARIPCIERINMPRAPGAGGWCRFAFIDRFCSNLNTRVLPVSEDLARELHARGVAPRKIVVLRDFIDPERFRGFEQRARARTELGLGPDARVVLSMGRMAPEKAHGDFLHLAVRLGARDQRWQFVLAGDGPLREWLEQRVSDLGIYRRCRILPFRRDVASLLAAADVYVQTSHWEGLATVILEAMAAGLPIAATDVGGTREALAEYPYHRLVVPGDTGAMLAAVEELWARADDGARREAHPSRVSVPFPVEFTREAVRAHFVRIVREAAGLRET
jgi:glycosyltransferase involved in cell wall biosynthesis